MSELVKVEDLRPGERVRDEEGGTGEVVEVKTYYLPFPGFYQVEVTYAPALEMEDVQVYRRGYELERVSGGEDA